AWSWPRWTCCGRIPPRPSRTSGRLWTATCAAAVATAGSSGRCCGRPGRAPGAPPRGREPLRSGAAPPESVSAGLATVPDAPGAVPATPGAVPDAPGSLPGSLAANPVLARWLDFGRGGEVTVRVGKVEYGQGIWTALAQVAAEELQVDLARVRMAPVSTSTSPDEGVTSGSRSVQDSGSALRQACA